MDIQCVTRKRIWEIDCWSLDTAIAASFDWRDFVNILQGSGHSFDPSKPESLLDLQAQCLIHEYCHSENPVSIRIENLMNEWHKRTLDLFDGWTPSAVAEHVLTVPLDKKSTYGAIFWALGSDSRGGLDCIRRRFHQRFQVVSARRLESASA